MINIAAVLSLIYRNNFKRHLYQKQKTFSWFFIAFLEFAWNLEYFQKKDDYPSLIISKIIDAERCDYLNV